MLLHLQSVSFEINIECPLAKAHAGVCPISDPTRFDTCDKSRPITDKLIIDSVDALYNKLNFRGWINWHYFNDPAVAFDRIESLVPLLRALHPKVRIGLFTNGIALPSDVTRLRCFNRIWLKDYTHDRNWSELFRSGIDIAYSGHPTLDGRMKLPKDENPGALNCTRMFDEMCIDHYGYGHICTGDWCRRVSIGNIWDIGISGVAGAFVDVRDAVCQSPMSEQAPEFCKTCGMPDKRINCVIDHPIFEETQRWKKQHGLPTV